MAFYSGNIATQVINPQFNQSKYRSEFRLHSGGMYLSNMRLMNLGLIVNQQSIIDNDRYNIVTGTGAIIRNIYLYDGKTVLDSVTNFADIQAFRNYNNLNSVNADTSKVLNRHGLGYVYDRTPPPATPSTEDPLLPSPPLVKEFNPACPAIPHLAQESSPLGYLSLRSVFPLLQQLEFLDTELFENLRVVVEYYTDNSMVREDPTSSAAITGTTLPILVVDQIMNPELIAKTRAGFKSVVWNAYEVETVVLDKLVASGDILATQSKKFRLNGFSNKTLVSLVVQKQPTESLSKSYRNHGSVALFDETWQVVVNGSNLLPDSGVTTPNYRLSLLNDSFDALNTFPGNTGLSMYKPQNFVDGSVLVDGDGDIIGHDKISSLDYFGVLINQKVTSLDIICGRSVKLAYDLMYAQAINLNCIGQVVKSIVKSAKGGYNVVYL
jgi:hypothetical protein